MQTMKDPFHSRSSASGVTSHETVAGDAVDLTDIASQFDDATLSYNNDRMPPLVSSEATSGATTLEEQFHLDLTRLGTYSDRDDYTMTTAGLLTVPLSQEAQQQIPMTPTPHDVNEELYAYHHRDVDLVSPTPPTPIPRFQVFDLTHFIEDDGSRSARKSETTWKDSAGGQTPKSWRESQGVQSPPRSSLGGSIPRRGATSMESNNNNNVLLMTPQPRSLATNSPSRTSNTRNSNAYDTPSRNSISRNSNAYSYRSAPQSFRLRSPLLSWRNSTGGSSGGVEASVILREPLSPDAPPSYRSQGTPLSYRNLPHHYLNQGQQQLLMMREHEPTTPETRPSLPLYHSPAENSRDSSKWERYLSQQLSPVGVEANLMQPETPPVVSPQSRYTLELLRRETTTRLVSPSSRSSRSKQVLAMSRSLEYYQERYPDEVNTAVMVRESEVVVHPPTPQHSARGNHRGSEHSRIHYSSSNHGRDSSNSSSDVPSTVDMFDEDHIMGCSNFPSLNLPRRVGSCDSMFDTLCRGMRPADSATVAPSVTRTERAEIRSCGTLPPDQYSKPKSRGRSKPQEEHRRGRSKQQEQHQKHKKREESHRKKHPSKKSAEKGKAKNTRKNISQSKSFQEQLEPRQARSSYEPSPPPSPKKKFQDRRKKGYQELPALSVKEDSVQGRGRTGKSNSYDEGDQHKEYMLHQDKKYRDKNCSQTSVGGVTTTESVKSDQATVVSHVDSVIDQREWMGNFVRQLFEQDETKAVFYASSIAETSMMKENGEDTKKKPGYMVGDYNKVKDYVDFVLQNLDLTDVLENIDGGIYDEHLDDFQEDIELCLEAAMDKHDTFMKYENRKWNGKYSNDDHSVATRQRHQNLRLLAGEELMKQLDADFRMQLLEHFCQQITKQHEISKRRRPLHKRQQRVRQ